MSLSHLPSVGLRRSLVRPSGPGVPGTEIGLPLLHPYGTVAPGRYVTPGGGRLTIKEAGAHIRITLDHLGCPAQLTKEKNAAFKRLGLAAEEGFAGSAPLSVGMPAAVPWYPCPIAARPHRSVPGRTPIPAVGTAVHLPGRRSSYYRGRCVPRSFAPERRAPAAGATAAVASSLGRPARPAPIRLLAAQPWCWRCAAPCMC
ncbi:DUF6420 family protein [Streptomyces sp. NPDC056647]|uniref:DUF6420 family protein n=1 Tax=Streptomyces sp. NPDC056647 TaxID=3345890 RepID=UPI0036B888E7